MKILNILIATIKDREKEFKLLKKEFDRQILENKLKDKVSIVYICDNREISVGLKRQKLLEKADAKWIVFFDDDDKPNKNYVKWIVEAIQQNKDIDCIGIRGKMTYNGVNPQTWCHRLKYKNWDSNIDGWDYVRPIIHFNPVLRTKALEAGFKDIRFGEDKDYSERLNKLLTKEFFIDKELFLYQYSNNVEHNTKYGIVVPEKPKEQQTVKEEPVVEEQLIEKEPIVEEKSILLSVIIQGGNYYKLGENIEIIGIDSQGRRQQALLYSKGKFVVFINASDQPCEKYSELIVNAINENPNADCIGIIGTITIGTDKTFCHSIKYKNWADNVDNYDYVRPPTQFNPLLRSKLLTLNVCQDDQLFSMQAKDIFTNEVFINENIIHYLKNQ